IQVEGEEVVRITGEHPVAILKANGDYEWVPAGKLARGTFVGAPHAPAEFQALVVTTLQEQGWKLGSEEDDTTYIDDARFRWHRILAPETEDYDGWVYNFSVDMDESYTLAAGFVVHNCDFFKNNAYFRHTNRKMMDEMANHGTRIRSYVERFGEDEV